MRLAEELIILLLNEESGYLEQVHGWNLSCVLAGAVLADLALESRIDTDLESLTLIDATPTGDELLDPVLAEIADESETRNAQFWVEKDLRPFRCGARSWCSPAWWQTRSCTRRSAVSGRWRGRCRVQAPIARRTARCGRR